MDAKLKVLELALGTLSKEKLVRGFLEVAKNSYESIDNVSDLLFNDNVPSFTEEDIIKFLGDYSSDYRNNIDKIKTIKWVYNRYSGAVIVDFTLDGSSRTVCIDRYYWDKSPVTYVEKPL